MKKVLLSLLPLLLSSTAFAVDDANPALEQFNPAITFYASFDGHGEADLSVGDGTPYGNAQNLQFAKGIYGQALAARNNTLIYHAKDNIDLSKSGSLLMWISPADDWTDADAPIQLGFASIHNQGETLMLARQGGKVNRQALMAIFAPEVMNLQTRALTKNSNTTSWAKGEWHLLAMNWSKGSVELSVDGNSFIKKISASPPTPNEDTRADLAIAGNSTEKSPYLMDELMILNRPLTNDEVNLLFTASK